MDLRLLIDDITHFRDERNWKQFHTPRNLSAALAIETAELQETMLWKDDAQVTELASSKAGHGDLSDEIADVLIYALLFCEAAGIDPARAIQIKLEKNKAKYPVRLSRGRAVKYTDLDGDT